MVISSLLDDIDFKNVRSLDTLKVYFADLNLIQRILTCLGFES